MGDVTKIEWTDHTFNPWIGCTKVSAGCANCYAEARDHRFGRDRWGPGKPRTRTAPANWRKPLQWNADAEKEGRRHRVFCASLADVFDAEIDPAWRFDLLALIGKTPWLDWQLLTKRPENVAKLWPALLPGIQHYQNVWLGTSVEDQAAADKRIPELLRIPASVRFLSCEPLLGPLDLRRWIDEDENGFVHDIHWIILGGESGPKSRPMHIEWVRSVLNQLRDAGRGECAVFVKQLGAKPISFTLDLDHPRGPEVQGQLRLADKKGGDWDEWPADLRIREFPESRP